MDRFVLVASEVTNYPIVEIIIYIGVVCLAGYACYALWKKLRSL